MTLRSFAAALALALSSVASGAAAADLTVTQTGGGAATAGQTRNFVITASSVSLGLPPGITVTVTTSLMGATPSSAYGSGWSCSTSGTVVTCSRSNGLAAGAFYPAITVAALIGAGSSYSSCAAVTHTTNGAVQPDMVADNNKACVTGAVGQPATGRICVVKFHDQNNDMQRQGNEAFLSGWFFNMSGLSGSASGATNNQGSLCRDLPPGNYTVAETLKPGWVSTTPGGASPSLPAVVTAGNTTTLTFGNRKASSGPPALKIEKFNESTTCNISSIGPCKFRIRITNIGSTAYNGPVTFSDTISFAVTGNNQFTIPIAPLPTGWSCSASGPPVVCNGMVSLSPNQSVDVVLFLKLTFPHPVQNCVRLSAPIAPPPFCIAL